MISAAFAVLLCVFLVVLRPMGSGGSGAPPAADAIHRADAAALLLTDWRLGVGAPMSIE